ncbi:MAG TPA: GNAT family N-acetyltransferase [Bacillus sp. (in: firmicutes)]|uniref:GNAT family N-acetyltransferase n=1 Tax=Bacillus litorisediminis TaxID=2922713 RepID=UPI001FAE7EE1|nr:GNAT family N-acetyltransferase [Bacillus litorisediminis]HWO76323.1 GNAT family N-acetyltransferase [Bacillus sp. (in: firmicutes)]
MLKTNQFKIVEYSDKYAAQVAEMWNESRDSWGGDQTIKTAESIRNTQESSGNITTFLVLDGEKVVGYCGLSEYRDDTGALYIPLLNVHPAYHGKRLGKLLVLKAIEKTIELGWPRLDLYTWPGNTKAVPLYKKCGFFWEERDNTTHLINFIPSLIQHPLCAAFFAKNDWYSSSVRTIEVKPDGRKEHGFTYYAYDFRGENDEYLQCEFELTGRTLRSIHTNELTIELSLPAHELIEGESYEAKLRIINKNKIPITIQATAFSNERIEISYSERTDIESGESVLSLPFKVRQTELGEPAFGKTHPLFKIELSVNGSSFPMAVGIKPKSPAKCQIYLRNQYAKTGSEQTIYAEIESFLDYDTVIEIEPSQDEHLAFPAGTLIAKLEKKGITVIEIPCIVKKPGVYSCKWQMSAEKESGERNSFSSLQTLWIPGIHVNGFGETEEEWMIVNGYTKLTLQKETNLVKVDRIGQKEGFTHFRFPQIGKPYSNELSKQKAVVSAEQTETCITLQAKYHLTSHPGLELYSIFTLHAEGLLEYRVKIENNGEVTYQDLYVIQNFHHQLRNTILPQGNEIIKFTEPKENEYAYLDSKRFSEPWIYTEYNPYHFGISWPKSANAFISGWFFYVEHSIRQLAPKQAKDIEPIILAAGTFQSWQDFRSFTMGEDLSDHVAYADDFCLEPQEKNPIINDEIISLSLKSKKILSVSGIAELLINGKKEEQHIIEGQRSLEARFSMKKDRLNSGLIRLEGSFDSNSRKMKRELYLLSPDPKQHIQIAAIGKSLKANNGYFEWRASATFFPGLYSLKDENAEWLDSSFPILVPKQWWNPWSGGIYHMVAGISNYSLAKEKSDVDQTILIDSCQNKWVGLKVTTRIENHQQWKGLELNQYFVSLPGAPVLAAFASLMHPDKIIDNLTIVQMANFMTENQLPTIFYDRDGLECSYSGGIDEQVISQTGNKYCERLKLNRTSHSLLLLDPEMVTDSEWYLNREVTLRTASQKISALPGHKVFTNPHFYITHSHPILKNSLRLFQQLSFKEV